MALASTKITYVVEEIDEIAVARVRFSCPGCTDITTLFYVPVRLGEAAVRRTIDKHCPVYMFEQQLEQQHPEVRKIAPKYLGLTGSIPLLPTQLDLIGRGVEFGVEEEGESEIV